jgi:PAS domain S-box-containing protein
MQQANNESNKTICKLEQSKELLCAITDNSNTVFFMKDLAGRYLFVNNTFEKSFQINSAAIVGKTDYDIFSTEMADTFAKHDQKVIYSQQSISIEIVLPHNDGHHVYISIRLPLRSPSGEVYATCGIATDITDRKHSEVELANHNKRLNALIEAIPDAIFFNLPKTYSNCMKFLGRAKLKWNWLNCVLNFVKHMKPVWQMMKKPGKNVV